MRYPRGTEMVSKVEICTLLRVCGVRSCHEKKFGDSNGVGPRERSAIGPRHPTHPASRAA